MDKPISYENVKCSVVHPLGVRNCVAYSAKDEKVLKKCPFFELEDDFGTPNWWKDATVTGGDMFVNYLACNNCYSMGDKGFCEKDRWGNGGVDNWEGVEGLDNL